MSGALTAVRLVAASALFFFSVFAVVPVPLRLLWIPALAATAFGHWLAAISLVVALAGWGGALQTAAFALSLSAAILFATPAARAFNAASRVQEQGRSLWGAAPVERGLAGPFSLAALLSRGPRRVPVQRHAFDPDNGLELEVYGPFDGKPRPLVVAIHGGSWNSGDYTQLPELNHHLANRGWCVAAITYRLAPTHTFPRQRDDVLRAIRWLEEHAPRFAIDPSRIALLGRSAGGQLALLAAYLAEDPAIKGVVSYYGPTDMNYAWTHPTNPWVLDTPTTLKEYLGGTPDEVPDHYRDASPWEFVQATTPPTLLIHGQRDELVSHDQTDRLRQRLAQQGVPHFVVSLPWATHGLEANLRGPGGQISTWAVERFLAHVFR